MTIPTPSPRSIIASGATLSSLCIVAVSMRFWARSLQRAKLSVDDWLMLPALLMTIGIGVTIIAGVRLKALGYPTPAPNPSNPDSMSRQNVLSAQLEWAFQMMQVIQLGAIKLSFVFFFRRIFVVGKSSNFALLTASMIGIISIWIIAFFLTFLFACGRHVSAWWSPSFQTECIHSIAFEYGFTLSDFLMDVIIMAMPVPMVWRLHMTTGRKIAVIGIFAFGLLAVIASLLRLIVFCYAKNVAYGKGTDYDLLTTTILFWSMIESVLALLAVCLPVLHTIFRKVSIESVINSIRSMVSLRSGARSSRGPHTDIENRNGSTTSHAKIVPNDAPHASIENIAMRDLSNEASEQTIPQGEIAVNTTFTQTYNTV